MVAITNEVATRIIMTSKDILKDIIRSDIDHFYFKSKTVAGDYLLRYFGIDFNTENYEPYLMNWVAKIRIALKELEEEGYLEIYSKNRRYVTYRKLQNGGKAHG